MSLIDLYQDFNIQFQTEGHKHCRPGWVNTACPFCTGNPGLHLGFNLSTKAFYCWRCGWHPQDQTIAELLNVSKQIAKETLRKYEINSRAVIQSQNHTIKFKPHKLPSDCHPLSSKYCKGHRAYLRARHFNPDQLEQDWRLMGTGPTASLDRISYRYRIIIPVVWKGRSVSFQGRDITGKTDLRYQSCPKNREAIPHQSILYGRQDKWGDTGICVEGVTDVWRLGFSAFAVFGIDYSHAQVREMKKHFKKVFVMFDIDPQAVRQGEKLVADLQFRGVEAEQIIIPNDPADMDQDEANALVSRLLTK